MGEKLVSIVLEGLDGQALIARIMEDYRNNPLSQIGDIKLVKTVDYLNDNTGLPKSNVLEYTYDDGSWFSVRPSGTEPKIKLYIYSMADNFEASQEKINLIYEKAEEKIKKVK